MRHGGRSRVGTALIGALVAIVFGAPSAVAAPVSTLIGQTATGNNNGGCQLCSAVQWVSASGGNSYVFPYDGVLTTVFFRSGSFMTTGEWAQARSFRLVDASHAKVMAEGAQQTITATSSNQQFYERIPVTAGDVLGARYHASAFIDDMPNVYTAPTFAGDRAGTDTSNPGPQVGQDATAPPFTNDLRVNVAARLEHDEDHDSYGDGTQDLCVGDAAHANVACSGALFGSNLQGAYQSAGPACSASGSACVRVQTTVGGASTAASVDGVVVRWRMLAPRPGTYRARILEPDGAGAYVLARSSDPVVIGSDTALWTFATRLPIKAGGYVGMAAPVAPPQTTLITPPAGSTVKTAFDTADGTTASLSGPGFAAVIGYDADVEPDADHDGYGDVSQDQCPADASTHGPCPGASSGTGGSGGSGTGGTGSGGSGGTGGTGGGGSGGTGGTTPPQITAFTLSSKRFRVQHAGAIVAVRRAHSGTTLVIAVADTARIRVTVTRLTTGARVGKRCVKRTAANRRRPRCSRSTLAHRFTRAVSDGTNALPYSGRYRTRGRTRELRPGRYRFTVAALDASGKPAAARSRLATVAR